MRISCFLPPARSDLRFYWLGADMVSSETYNIQKTAITTQRAMYAIYRVLLWARSGLFGEVPCESSPACGSGIIFFCLFCIFGDRANQLASCFVMRRGWGFTFCRPRLGIGRGRLEIVLQSTLGREHGIVCRRNRQTDRQGGDGVVWHVSPGIMSKVSCGFSRVVRGAICVSVVCVCLC